MILDKKVLRLKNNTKRQFRVGLGLLCCSVFASASISISGILSGHDFETSVISGFLPAVIFLCAGHIYFAQIHEKQTLKLMRNKDYADAKTNADEVVHTIQIARELVQESAGNFGRIKKIRRDALGLRVEILRTKASIEKSHSSLANEKLKEVNELLSRATTILQDSKAMEDRCKASRSRSQQLLNKAKNLKVTADLTLEFAQQIFTETERTKLLKSETQLTEQSYTQLSRLVHAHA